MTIVFISSHATLRSTVARMTVATASLYTDRMKRLLLASLLLVASAAQAKEVLPWIENDYAKAIAHARSADLPVFVEAWAPW
jgi:hypothetical protein